jgi:HEAT repeat protein
MPKIKRDEDNQPTRPSTLVNRRVLPVVQERENLNRLLRVHDPEVAAANRIEITTQHAPLLRQIALEGPHAGGDPGARKQAIAWLGRLAAPDDLNVLVQLAQFDPDAGVRSAALVSLGASGLQLAAPILAAALASRDAVEAVAAAKALYSLADRIGADPVLSPIRDARLSKLAKKALDAREMVPRGRKRSSTRADSKGSSREPS